MKFPTPPDGNSIANFPLYFAFILTILAGTFLLHRSAAQARDTMRKHHLQDIEDSLYTARSLAGTYPPYQLSSWCGFLNPTHKAPAITQIEAALRQQNNLYANPAKPFPRDPGAADYLYVKRSPSAFELYAQVETDPSRDFPSLNCPDLDPLPGYNYHLTSLWRES